MRRPIAMLFSIAVAGCGDIIGLGGYTDQGEGGPDGEGIDAGKDTALNDTGSATDGPKAEACNGNPEDCTNGVDDDCNGAADCADMACKTGFVCVPALPNGWTLTGYGQDQRPACATGYAGPTDVEEGLNAGAATCGCGCTTTQPNCATGNLVITAGGNGNCNTTTNQMDTAAAGCNATNPNFTTNGDSISVTGPSPSGGNCGANGSKMVPTVTYQHQGRTCSLAGDVGVGCMNGNVCAANPAPFVSCVSQKGMQACPTGFPVQHLVGTMLADTRDCTACTCKFNAGACEGTATFYGDNGCTTNATNVTVDGLCHNVPNHTYRAYKYSPTTNASCTASNSNATGGVTFADLTTVCCTN